MLEQRAEMLNLYHIGLAVGFRDDRVYLHQTPMFHAASMGGALGIPTTGGVSTFVPLFEPGAVLSTIEEFAVDWTVMVPTMIAMTLDHPSFDPARMASMQDLVYGASPMPTALLDRIQKALPALNLWQGYGMTECSSVLTILSAADHARGATSCGPPGRPVVGVELTIQDEAGAPVARGVEGEVCAKGGNFLREYWNRPEQTEHVLRGGWYHTGDVGHIDQAGYLHLVDRLNDMIVSGGENVYSIEVENAISTHPAVSQVAVIGIPHPVWGEQVHAIVVLRAGCTATEREIIDHARGVHRRLQGAQVHRVQDRAPAGLGSAQAVEAGAPGPVLGTSGDLSRSRAGPRSPARRVDRPQTKKCARRTFNARVLTEQGQGP